MREIKFRAWWKDTREPILDFMEQYTIDVLNDLPDNPFIYSQFTGLHDKNGKEIWEGDILSAGTSALISLVMKWDKDRARFMIHGHNASSHKNFRYNGSKWKNKVEVIGNIYENPKLLFNDHSTKS